MPAYFQMGHDSENLVGEEGLGSFRGIVLSPLNRSPGDLERHIAEFRRKGSFDIMLDPQLYFPFSNKGKLQEHPYYPADFETADLTSTTWWNATSIHLIDYGKRLGVNSISSPVSFPRVFSLDYYSFSADVAAEFTELSNKAGIRPLVSIVVDLRQLSNIDVVMKIASIVSEPDSAGYYIVLSCDVDPRREIADSEGLLGVLTLVHELEQTGRPVLVSQCSSDMVLFKAAGATHCSTGKFFNLRRFTKSRYDEDAAGGGGQLPYWFEQSLLAYLREADVLRLRRDGFEHLLRGGCSDNNWSRTILERLASGDNEPWLKYSWRQYLSWFGNAEIALTHENAISVVRQWLKDAEANWTGLEDNDLLMEEPRNDGSWIRPWRIALSEFKKRCIAR